MEYDARELLNERKILEASLASSILEKSESLKTRIFPMIGGDEVKIGLLIWGKDF